MKIDPNAPAYPHLVSSVQDEPFNGQSRTEFGHQPGMTIRAAMATQIMAGLVQAAHADPQMARVVVNDANANFNGSCEACIADTSLNYTDALIAALNGDGGAS